MILRSEVAQRVFNTPLMIHPDKAMAILTAVGGRLVEGGVSFENGMPGLDHVGFENGRPSMGRLGDRLGRAFDGARILPFDMVGDVAVIPVEGTLVHKGAFVGMSSGRTSYQGLQTQVQRAAATDLVKGVVFEVDSFGGEVSGVFETAAMMARLSKAKPTLAILTDNAASAGYLLASAARQVVMPERGVAGSIGALSVHLDTSRKLANDGVTVTLLTAGKHKADGNPFEPLPKALADRITAHLEEVRQTFAATVGRHRAGRFTARAALATEADIFRGSEAVDLGMVDAIGDPNQAFDAFVKAVKST